ncbi:hypothetical protein LSS_15991 [Leptospira santarosai serovar Shermani str. LT 821]|uniref:Uncharacterized protein n=1 Tax=Leptospira santarosai serovar Shermani str. LT 821 TaxID=758847 RepID=K8XWJ3_9LEPT|nr:hypothetical protein LSS_15991 [Leptospira santarosai serovar Shermani str. LT 821]
MIHSRYSVLSYGATYFFCAKYRSAFSRTKESRGRLLQT